MSIRIPKPNPDEPQEIRGQRVVLNRIKKKLSRAIQCRDWPSASNLQRHHDLISRELGTMIRKHEQDEAVRQRSAHTLAQIQTAVAKRPGPVQERERVSLPALNQ